MAVVADDPDPWDIAEEDVFTEAAVDDTGERGFSSKYGDEPPFLLLGRDEDAGSCPNKCTLACEKSFGRV